MLVRVWKVGLVPAKVDELEIFANNVSLPMFKGQPGCLAVFFTRTETECATITIWETEESIRDMEASSRYKEVVHQIEQSGILRNDHRTQVFSVYGGFINDDLPHRFAQEVHPLH